ncbi:hypothetical protein MHJ97_12465 [Macrococcus epidermidis]|uniref:hypothetical protein n=1 Tax=Macrococcus epidermidis TaxID=1902580 RepID=UPI001EF3A0BB|nr:hypothetical protein [Macrococcus epidermidis]MCG7421220.1 hypothetical protein [Macrococcus epidermidis]
MWNELKKNERDNYKRLILNFSSLSAAFSQKSTNGDKIVPIVNAKFQEKVFQYSFNAIAEDIGNTSFDASLIDRNKKYLIGIKSFNLKSN